MLCHMIKKMVGLWIVENSANSIGKVSHTTGKALVAYSKKKASKIKKLFKILKLNWYPVRPVGGRG